MLKKVIETDKLEFNQAHFYLTQGDSATIYSYPKKDGELIDFELIEKCLFKLSNSDYKEIFTKELIKDTDKFILELTHEDTTSIPVDTYIYEIEYTFVDGTVNTPNQWKFDILEQII